MRNRSVFILLFALLIVGCGKANIVQRVITKDIAIEDQNSLIETYKGRYAWTRMVLKDLTTREPSPGETRKGLVPRDTKILIVDLNFAFSGAVMVEDKDHKKYVQGLEIERPLTVEKIENRLNQIFWFKDPMLRHVDYIRQWGKKTARAVRNHEVFIGMPAEAAEESWGLPSTKNVIEITGRTEEQWIYGEGKTKRYIYLIDGKVSRFED